MKKSFGSIELLIVLLVLCIVFVVYVNAFKGVTIFKTNEGSIQEQVDERINEINNLKNQKIELEKLLLEQND